MLYDIVKYYIMRYRIIIFHEKYSFAKCNAGFSNDLYKLQPLLMPVYFQFNFRGAIDMDKCALCHLTRIIVNIFSVISVHLGSLNIILIRKVVKYYQTFNNFYRK